MINLPTVQVRLSWLGSSLDKQYMSIIYFNRVYLRALGVASFEH